MHLFMLSVLLFTIGYATCANDTLEIGAFNIRIFGRKKSNNDIVMKRITQIVEKYDIILVQEIRDITGNVIVDLLNRLNRDEEYFSVVVSNRLGRTSAKEQYAFYYRNDKLAVVDSYQIEDVDDVFEREPFSVKVQATMVDGGQTEFALIGLHAKPTDAITEMEELDEVYLEVSEAFQTPNAILMGDFNADCRYASARKLQTVTVFINNDMYTSLFNSEVDTTTTSTNCAYDRMLTVGRDTWKNLLFAPYVDRFDIELGLTNEEAKAISDHYPIGVTYDLATVNPPPPACNCTCPGENV